MIDTLIFADSGGTKTDWCVVKNGKKHFFRTESYHPIHWNDEFEDRISSFWNKELNPANARLYFFGAGCFNPKNVEKGEALLKRVGFGEVRVSSDVAGAAYSLFGKKSGVGAILGTGSVVFEWSGSEVIRLIGGKGHELGDEGSGYYFGKLIIDKWKTDSLSTTQRSILEQRNFSEYLECINEENRKEKTAAIAKLTADSSSEFREIHIENFRHFLKTHNQDNFLNKLDVVGGYVFHYQEIFRGFLAENKVELRKVLDEPIVYIVEQIICLNE